MANLSNGVARRVGRGKYAIKVDTNGGDATLDWTLQDGDSTQQNLLGDAAITEPSSFVVDLPKAILTPTLTGGATIRISTIDSFGLKMID